MRRSASLYVSFFQEELLPLRCEIQDSGLSDGALLSTTRELVNAAETSFRAQTRFLTADYFFRTPNLYCYVSLAAWATSHGIHKLIANRMRGLGEDVHKPWLTFYRLNTRRTIRHAARNAGFSKIDAKMVEGHRSYFMFYALPFFVGLTYERLVNSTDVLAGLRSNIFGQLIK